MALLRTMTEDLALKMLKREGIAAIWRLHLAAAAAHREGYSGSAASIAQIAEAAEEAWLRAEEARQTGRPVGCAAPKIPPEPCGYRAANIAGSL
jgi:hypothetical protein